MSREELAFGVEFGGVCDGSVELVIAVCAQLAPSRAPDLVLGQDVRDCARCPFGRGLAPPGLIHDQLVEGAIEDGAGKSGARLCLDAALEAAEDGHVARLQVRRALWREEAQHNEREGFPHGGQRGLAGVDAGHVPEEDPRLFLSAWIEHVVESGHKLQDRCRCCPAVF